VAVRAAFETNQEQSAGRVPFFDLAEAGGQSTLRGASRFRFRDRSMVGYGVEYRYRIWEYFDWALFVDQAQVAPEPGDFGLARFHTGYGARWLVDIEDFAMAIDAGRSREGWKLHFKLDPDF
jgi:outer membrane protein assembly factor BamA